MQSIPEEEFVEVEIGEKRGQRKRRFLGLLHSPRKDAAKDEVEELDHIKFHELLALNLPDWYLVLLGVICYALLGALFPFLASVFSGFLEVGASSTYPNVFLMCFY